MNGVMKKRAAGFIMLEILASLVIIGLTMVLISNVHNKAVKAAHDSLQRGRAVWMARDMIERMRVNIGSASSYVTVASVAADPAAFCLSANRTTQCLTGQCNTTQIVRFDIEQVICEATGMNNPRISLTCSTSTCDAGSEITVTVAWDSSGGNSGATQDVSLKMRR
ncbi:MAG: type IV pilus modification protein PilV [Endozoicomonas sp.]